MLTGFWIYFAGRYQAALFLEKILKRFARVIRPSGAGSRSFFLHTDAHGIERTVVAFIFTSDALGNGLAALESAGSIEIRALPAGVKFETALRALAGWLSSLRQQSAALGAARNRVGSRHVYRARPKGIFFDRLLACGLLPLFAAVLISVLTVFAV
jgi:hypothetical protein